MKTNLDVLRLMDKDLVAYLLYTIYNAKNSDDENTKSIFSSLESIKEWLDFVVDDTTEDVIEEQVEG